MSTTEIPLALPANRTVAGPRLRQERGQFALEYDCQGDDGSIHWSKIVFREVLAFEYRQESCCTADAVIGARTMRSATSSPWLADVLKRWNESVGWQEWQQKQGGASRFRHFTIYFDDAGSVDVVAGSCDVAEFTPER